MRRTRRRQVWTGSPASTSWFRRSTPLIPNVVVDSAPIRAASATHNCPLTGNVWGAGNILLGGAGSDLIEGRGADDIIDGDRYLNVRLSVRTDPASAASEIGSTDLMGNKAKTGNFGAGTTDMTLQQAVFAGLVDPGNIVAVREILSPGSTDEDVALFSEVEDQLRDHPRTDGVRVTVTHTGGTAADGIDTLRNVEIAALPRHSRRGLARASRRPHRRQHCPRLHSLSAHRRPGRLARRSSQSPTPGRRPHRDRRGDSQGPNAAASSPSPTAAPPSHRREPATSWLTFTPNAVRGFAATLEIAHDAAGSPGSSPSQVRESPPRWPGDRGRAPTPTSVPAGSGRPGRRASGSPTTVLVRCPITRCHLTGPFTWPTVGNCPATRRGRPSCTSR